MADVGDEVRRFVPARFNRINKRDRQAGTVYRGWCLAAYPRTVCIQFGRSAWVGLRRCGHAGYMQASEVSGGLSIPAHHT
jgi:hypothetical protein